MLGPGKCFTGKSGVLELDCVYRCLVQTFVAGWVFVGVERVPPWVVMLAVAVPAAVPFCAASVVLAVARGSRCAWLRRRWSGLVCVQKP